MACDRCWRLKARCVFDPVQDEDCALCRKQNAECVWTRSKKPTPAPDKDYVLYLENRTKEIEQRLRQVDKIKVLPGINIKREIDNLLEIRDDVDNEQSLSMANAATTSQTSNTRTRDNLTLSTVHSPSLVGSPFASRLLQAIRLTDVTVTSLTSHGDSETDSIWKSYTSDLLPQYYGPSSMEVLVEHAQSHFSRGAREIPHFRSEYWSIPRAESCAYANDPHIIVDLRKEIPPADLLSALVDAYFEHVNPILPVLHRPLFESQLHGNLHTRDEDFTPLLLVVCALGARWCEDSRVVDDQHSSQLSAGYRWFRSASKSGVNTIYRPSLINSQFTVLSFAFLLGSPFHDVAWLFAAKASRMFETLGVHRRKESHTLADELLKRSFRCYFILDRSASTIIGRPSAFQNVNIDLDDVMEIDDLCWAPEPCAQPPQPQGGSLQLAALNHSSRLWAIIGQALQTIFAPISVRVRIGLGSSQGEEWIARNINQQLNRWAASVPVNCIVIYIHPDRSSTLTRSKVPEIADASFHNCLQAARQCARMIHAYYEIPGSLPLQCTVPGVFSSAMILIVDLVTNSSPGHPGKNTLPEIPGNSTAANERDLEICAAALGRLEKHWHIAGRLNDVMKEFRALWSSRLSTQTTATTRSTPVSKEPHTHKARAPITTTRENSGITRLYAQQPASGSTLTSQPSTASELMTDFPDFGMEIPKFTFSQTQSTSDAVELSSEPQSFPHDSTLLSGEWMFNMDDVMVPGSEAFDIASLPPELGQVNLPNNWNDTMEYILKLSEGGSEP